MSRARAGWKLLQGAAALGLSVTGPTSLNADLALKAAAVRWFSTAVPATRATGVVPPGHLNSDLSSTVCHIGLARRRDLTMRQDIGLWKDGKRLSLAELFKGKKVIVVGFPGGPVCTEQHIPGYVQMAPALAKKGVDKVLCVTPLAPEVVSDLSKKPSLASPMVELMCDRNGGFIRLMGLELGEETVAKGPKCQRFAGIVEDGILLKVKVENTPADLKQTDVRSMCALWEEVYGHLTNKSQ